MNKSSDERNIAYCGIDCLKCPVYIATITDNSELKHSVMQDWGKLYKREFTVEEIYCYGCRSEQLFILCSRCDIKPCNLKRGIEQCEQCCDYPCSRIQRFYDWCQKHNINQT